MSTESNWIMANVGKSWYTVCRPDGRPIEDRLYDPLGISEIEADFHIRSPLTEKRARAMVDKLNGPRGQLRRVRGTRTD